VERLAGSHRFRLDNGLEVAVLEVAESPVVSTVLWYRAGARDEPPGQGGAAHFLEHMMFKGSPGYRPGAVDRRTQELGGVNNAFTGHDATVYYFRFSPDHWAEALAIEADRMQSLDLDPPAIDGERQVILEEIAMYQSDPWDALEEAVLAALFPGHAYGRPVLGTREELAAIGREELAAFHRRHYRPDRSLLVVAGPVRSSLEGVIRERFEAIERSGGTRPLLASPSPPSGEVRVERRHGEVPRLEIALPAPPAHHPDHPGLTLLTAALTGGRGGRLQRVLVEEEERCLWVSADLGESEGPGALTVAAELHPGVAPEEVETLVREELTRLAAEPMLDEEVERIRALVAAEWVLGHEASHDQALALATALAVSDPGYLGRRWEGHFAVGPSALRQVAARYLDLDRGGVVGWSLPAGDG
jgi:zinc protease